ALNPSSWLFLLRIFYAIANLRHNAKQVNGSVKNLTVGFSHIRGVLNESIAKHWKRQTAISYGNLIITWFAFCALNMCCLGFASLFRRFSVLRSWRSLSRFRDVLRNFNPGILQSFHVKTNRLCKHLPLIAASFSKFLFEIGQGSRVNIEFADYRAVGFGYDLNQL